VEQELNYKIEIGVKNEMKGVNSEMKESEKQNGWVNASQSK
jgi:hypothetical protein